MFHGSELAKDHDAQRSMRALKNCLGSRIVVEINVVTVCRLPDWVLLGKKMKGEIVPNRQTLQGSEMWQVP